MKAACGSYQEINAIDTIVSFVIPIVFSILYIPLAYIFALWAKYEIVFIRMSFKEPKDKNVRWSYRKEVLKVCNFSFKKVYCFNKECIKNMYISMKQEEFRMIIKKLKADDGGE